MTKYPEKFESLSVKYKDEWRRGYWNGTIFTLIGKEYMSLIFVELEDIQEWKYEEWV